MPEAAWCAQSYKSMGKTSLVDDKLSKVDALKPLAAELGASLAQLSLAWCANNPNVSSVIMGATKKEQVPPQLPALSRRVE